MRRINGVGKKRTSSGAVKYRRRRGGAIKTRRYKRRRTSTKSRIRKQWSAALRRVVQPRTMSKRWISNAAGSQNANSWVYLDACNIPKATDVATLTDPRVRDSDTVQISGFKLDMAIRNKTNTEKFFKIYAVIKKTIGVPSDMDALVNTSNSLSPFLNWGDNSASGLQTINCRLNTNIWDPIWSKTIRLGPQFEASAASIQSNLPGQVSFKKFVKYGKRYNFDVTTPNRVYFVFVNDDPMRGPGAAGADTDYVDYQMNAVTYFIDQ